MTGAFVRTSTCLFRAAATPYCGRCADATVPMSTRKPSSGFRSRIPDASITADVIVGFPGESDRDFRDTYELCERISFTDMHVFPYSVRPGTSAAHYEDHVAPDVKSERMQALLELAKRQARQFRLSRIGATRRVLWESQGMRDNSLCWLGLTDDYIRVMTRNTHPLLNEVTPTTLTALANDGIMEADLN